MRLHVERQTASPPLGEPRESARAPSRSSATRSRSSIGARGATCRRGRGAHEKCATGSASRTRTTSAKPASARYAERRPRHAELVARDEVAGVERPGDDRHEHDARRRAPTGSRSRAIPIPSPTVSSGSATRIVRATSALERRRATAPAAEDRRVVPLQPPLLPEVERRRGRPRRVNPGERGEHEADVEDEEDARVVAPPRARCPPPAPRDAEQHGGERHDAEAEQPVRGAQPQPR